MQTDIEAPADTSWSKERVDRLVEMYHAGCTAAYMGAQLGVTRSKAIGKLYRLGYKKVGGGQKKAAEPRRSSSVNPREPKRSALTNMPLKTKKTPPSIPKTIAIPESLNVYLIEIPDKGCKFPVKEDEDGIHLFCGVPSTKRGYCAYHNRVAWVNPKSRPKPAQRMTFNVSTLF